MFTKRIIPCLDVNNGRVVKGVNFVQLRDAGDPVEIAKAYDAAVQPRIPHSPPSVANTQVTRVSGTEP